ncbi:PadR family transcriptional regulator [Paeniglutamicibacter antarcticus]|uniref:PadR family transcriptional regulator n=1 Tax=Paeniglutamicibacter antarcticus TaxID=494023 RepID=A0ABP9TKD8_9MICC
MTSIQDPGQAGAEWPSDWLRAALGLCTLQALETGPTYGYAIIAALAEAGLGKVKGGTLYPLLTRFETAGFLEVEWRPGDGGPGRKYFSLTDSGQKELARQRTAWHSFTQVTTTFLAGNKTPSATREQQ